MRPRNTPPWNAWNTLDLQGRESYDRTTNSCRPRLSSNTVPSDTLSLVCGAVHVGGTPYPDMPTHACEHRWWASRVEVETLPVLHVRAQPAGHGGLQPHRCSCGATAPAPGPAGPLARPAEARPAAAPPAPPPAAGGRPPPGGCRPPGCALGARRLGVEAPQASCLGGVEARLTPSIRARARTCPDLNLRAQVARTWGSLLNVLSPLTEAAPT